MALQNIVPHETEVPLGATTPERGNATKHGLTMAVVVATTGNPGPFSSREDCLKYLTQLHTGGPNARASVWT